MTKEGVTVKVLKAQGAISFIKTNICHVQVSEVGAWGPGLGPELRQQLRVPSVGRVGWGPVMRTEVLGQVFSAL